MMEFMHDLGSFPVNIHLSLLTIGFIALLIRQFILERKIKQMQAMDGTTQQTTPTKSVLTRIERTFIFLVRTVMIFWLAWCIWGIALHIYNKQTTNTIPTYETGTYETYETPSQPEPKKSYNVDQRTIYHI